MPELPDVEVYRRYIASTSLHQKISKVTVRSGRILSGVSARQLQSGLTGRKMEATERHGKHLFVLFDDGKPLMMHFGMTGDVQYFKNDDVDYDRLRIDFATGYHLAYISRRQLGKIAFVKNIDDFIRGQKLGPDALSLERSEFMQCIRKGRGSVKSLLMNQKIIAGIGNIYSDEILFQAGVHPGADVRKLSAEKKREIYRQIRRVLNTAIKKRARPENFPRTYMIPHRDGDGKCPGCGGKMKSIKMSGRTSYYCPACQRKT